MSASLATAFSILRWLSPGANSHERILSAASDIVILSLAAQ